MSTPESPNETLPTPDSQPEVVQGQLQAEADSSQDSQAPVVPVSPVNKANSPLPGHLARLGFDMPSSRNRPS